MWACDFLPVVDVGFALFAFFIIDLGSRQVVHVGVTRHPTDGWVAQQLREATPFGAARANATCERFLGSVRRECLDHLLILHEGQLRRVLRAYRAYVNMARPHQGIGQTIPIPGNGKLQPTR